MEKGNKNMPTIKEEMDAIDKRNYGWYDTLTAENKKKFGMWVRQRWASAIDHPDPAIREWVLTTINDNVNCHFNDITHHPELQMRLMQTAGIGKSLKRGWVSAMKQKKDESRVSKQIFKFYLDKYPHLKDDELVILVNTMPKDEMKQELLNHGLSDKQVKALMK
jgi:hypothetical protein